MRRVLSVCAFAACLAWLAPVGAQVDESLVEDLCTEGDKCSDDNLAIAFEGATAEASNVISGVTVGQEVTANVMVSAVSEGIQGWSYAVASDEAFVSITDEGLVLEGTATDANKGDNPFFQNKVVAGGYISAIVLDLFGNGILPLGEQKILITKYTVDVVPTDAAGTLLRFVNQEIGVEGSPAVEINITAGGGQSRQPRKLTQGAIKGDDVPVDCVAENALYFGADTEVAEVSVAAGGSTVISSRNTAGLLGFQLGVAVSGTNQWSFSDALGNNEIIETIFTDATGASVPAAKGNTAQAVDAVTAVTKGAALADFANDFFQADLTPEQGGDGFIVGYVADVVDGAGQIPATADVGSPCPTNELLVVQTGEAVEGTPFNRGDANGDGKFNVTDGILIVQAQVGNIASKYPDCPAINDANGDGTNDLSDAIYLLNYVFVTTAPAPPAPFRTCASAEGAVCAVDSGNCTP